MNPIKHLGVIHAGIMIRKLCEYDGDERKSGTFIEMLDRYSIHIVCRSIYPQVEKIILKRGLRLVGFTCSLRVRITQPKRSLTRS